MHAFVVSGNDYCHSMFTGLPKKLIDRLRLGQNTSAWILTGTHKREQITLTLAILHWLPGSFRIELKVLLQVFKWISTAMYYGLSPYVPSHSLRSNTANMAYSVYPKSTRKDEVKQHSVFIKLLFFNEFFSFKLIFLWSFLILFTLILVVNNLHLYIDHDDDCDDQ